jgi:hypothetical protein
MATRRLPVIQQPTGEDAEAAARPAWHWVLIGSGMLVTAFMPLALAALALARTGPVVRSLGAVGAAGIAVGVTFALAAATAGYLLARFGPRTQPRHAAFAGLAGAFELWVLVLLSGGFQPASQGVATLFMLCAVGAAFCTLGAWLARRSRNKSGHEARPKL